jgi:ABC-type enterochelin transport system substrate-binding protein
VIALVGCGTQTKPPYQAVTDFAPDCANKAARIRYYTKLKNTSPDLYSDVSESRYNKTIDIQIERLNHYCK